MINWIARPWRVLHLRQGRLLGRHERPLLLPLGPLIDPLADQFDLFGSQVPLKPGWRHPNSIGLGTDLLIQFALRGFSGNNDVVAAPVSERALFGIKPQARRPLLLIRPMAGKAIVRKDGTNLAVKIHSFGGRLSRRCRCRMHGNQANDRKTDYEQTEENSRYQITSSIRRCARGQTLSHFPELDISRRCESVGQTVVLRRTYSGNSRPLQNNSLHPAGFIVNISNHLQITSLSTLKLAAQLTSETRRTPRTIVGRLSTQIMHH